MTIIFASMIWTYSAQIDYDLKQFAGYLFPAGDPDPPSFCSQLAGPNALKVFMGSNETFTDDSSYVVLRVHGTDRIVVERDQRGKISLNADILDDSGKIIVTFEHGNFTVVQPNILDMKRPDKSTLIVRDQHKNEVLNVRYLNQSSLRFSGLLKYPGITIPISKTQNVNRICAGGTVALDIE